MAALTADLVGAQAALAQAEALAGPAMRLFDTWPGPVHAWVAAARGEIPAAVDLALGTAAEARRRGQPGCELIALHDAARLGAPARAATRLAELAAMVQGDLASLFIRHVQALVAANGAVLDEIAASFAALGANLLAAEAAAEAAGAHRRAGRTGQRRGVRRPGGRAGRDMRRRPDPGLGRARASPSASPRASWRSPGWRRAACPAGRSRPGWWWRCGRSTMR